VKASHKYGVAFLASPEHAGWRSSGRLARQRGVLTLENGDLAVRSAGAQNVGRHWGRETRHEAKSNETAKVNRIEGLGERPDVMRDFRQAE